MLWTANLVQLALHRVASAQQPGSLMVELMVSAKGIAEALSVLGVVRRTKFPLLLSLDRQKQMELSATSLLAAESMMSSRAWFPWSLVMGEASRMMSSLWFLVKVGLNSGSGFSFLFLVVVVAAGAGGGGGGGGVPPLEAEEAASAYERRAIGVSGGWVAAFSRAAILLVRRSGWAASFWIEAIRCFKTCSWVGVNGSSVGAGGRGERCWSWCGLLVSWMGTFPVEGGLWGRDGRAD